MSATVTSHRDYKELRSRCKVCLALMVRYVHKRSGERAFRICADCASQRFSAWPGGLAALRARFDS